MSKIDKDGTKTHKLRIGPGGRVVIPAAVRRRLGVKVGDQVLLTEESHGHLLTTHRLAVRRAQDYFGRIKKPGESVVDELIAERREEAKREG